MIVQMLDGLPCRLREPFDLGFVSRWGRVFKIFDDQDSGNLCLGTERDGERFFLKFAGAPTLRYPGRPHDAVERLRQAVTVYRDLRHPCLIQLLEEGEVGGGYLAVFRWTDAVCAGKQYPESRARFFTLPVEKRQRVFADILDFHIFAAEQGYVAVDFYDGSILYDFDEEKTILCDIDFYRKGAFVNEMGRMWGSSRFMSPEEFTFGAPIDQVTNVYLMGAAAFSLLGGEGDRSREKWALGDSAYAVVLRAVSESRANRYQSLEELKTAWKTALIKCKAFPLNSLGDYRFTVIFARYQGQWVFPRHGKRQTFETAGGHVEPGETPLDCAKRELWEETGAREFIIRPVFDYWAADALGSANGMVFYADIEVLGELPQEFEMAELGLFPDLPEKVTYPYITPVLFDELRKMEAEGLLAPLA